jgi:LysM repeat protein
MTRKQMALIVAVNAVISTVISMIVALLVIRPAQVGSTATPSPGATSTRVVAATLPTEPGIVTHRVQSGDTISGLALKYDVPEEDIIAANNLQNPNFLQVGTELIIPIGGLPETTATFTPEPTATNTPLPFEPPSADMTATAMAQAGATATILPTPLPSAGETQIEINEIIAAGQVEQEQVIILNNGEQLADMQDWMLSDTEGHVYTFPNFRLWAEGNVIVHTRIGQDGNPPANFYWGKLEAIWSPGEIATLKNAAGEVISTYIVEP